VPVALDEPVPVVLDELVPVIVGVCVLVPVIEGISTVGSETNKSIRLMPNVS